MVSIERSKYKAYLTETLTSGPCREVLQVAVSIAIGRCHKWSDQDGVFFRAQVSASR